MSVVADDGQRGSVLLKTEDLARAHRRASDAGKKELDGLYLPSGKRVEEIAAHGRAQGSAAGNADAQQEQNLSRVAKSYKAKQQGKQSRAERLKKSQNELEDEEAAKRAKAILGGSTEHERMMYNELFSFFDVDKDRTWGTIEFAQRMTDIGCNTSVESASNLLYFAGVRDVDRITYEDFLQMMPKLKAFRRLLEKDAMRAFAERDVEGTGYLSTKALKEVIRSLAGPDGMDEHQVNHLVKKADRERTGRIPFAFFIKALFGTPPQVEYKPLPKKRGFLASIFGCGSTAPGRRADSDSSDEDTRL